MISICGLGLGLAVCVFFFFFIASFLIQSRSRLLQLISFVFVFFVVRRIMKECFFSPYFKYDIKCAYLFFTVFFLSFFLSFLQTEGGLRLGGGMEIW